MNNKQRTGRLPGPQASQPVANTIQPKKPKSNLFDIISKGWDDYRKKTPYLNTKGFDKKI